MGEGAMAIAMIVSAVASAGGAAYSAYVANDNAIDAEKAANKAADREREAAAKDAATIKERAARLQGMQRAALAASGADLGAGTSDTILGETARLSEQDALAAFREGRERADIIKQQGQLTAGNFRAQSVANALGGVSSLAGGITSYQQATAGTRSASSINLNTDKAIAARTSAPKYSLLGG